MLSSPLSMSHKEMKKGQLGLVEGSMVLLPVVALVALVGLILLTLLKIGLPK